MMLIREYDTAKDNEYVKKPVSYALYQTWKKWDQQENPKQEVKKHE